MIYILLPVIIAVGIGLYIGYSYARIEHFKSLSRELIDTHISFTNTQGSGGPKILVAGDSTAVGLGTKDPSGTTIGYFQQDFPDATLRLHAKNGLETQGLVDSFPVTTENEYDLIVLQIGANDILDFTKFDEFQDSLNTLFEKATYSGRHVAALHSGNIGAAPIFVWPLNWIMTWRTKKIMQIYKEVASIHGVAYVDLFRSYENDQIKGDMKYYSKDKIHFNKNGYRVWYDAIRNTMQKHDIQITN